MAKADWVYTSRKTRTTVFVVVALGLVATILFLLLGRISGLDAKPGFLGTYAPLYSDINLILEIIIVIGLTIGYFLIRARQRSAHQHLQTSMVLWNLVFMLFFMGIIFVQLLNPATTFSLSVIAEILHGVVGLIAILLGLYLVLHMNDALPKKMQTKAWKNLMRIALGLYALVGLGGIAVYILFFVPLK